MTPTPFARRAADGRELRARLTYHVTGAIERGEAEPVYAEQCVPVRPSDVPADVLHHLRVAMRDVTGRDWQ